jgi:uncharacterized protein YcfL
MKKYLKLFSLFLIIGLVLCGCAKDEEEVTELDNPPVVEENNLEKNITTSEVSMFTGEFSDKCVVLMSKNDNDKPVYINYSFEMFDKNKRKLYNKEVYVRVGSKDSAYVVAIQDLEEESFDSYSYTFKVLEDKLNDYDIIKNGIKTEYKDTGKNIVVTFNNIGKRTTTAYGLVFFYKNNKLVAVKNVESYYLVPYKIDNIDVTYPIKTVSERILFDRVDFILNEVSTEL